MIYTLEEAGIYYMDSLKNTYIHLKHKWNLGVYSFVVSKWIAMLITHGLEQGFSNFFRLWNILILKPSESLIKGQNSDNKNVQCLSEFPPLSLSRKPTNF